MNMQWIKRCACGALLRKTILAERVSCTSCNEVWQEIGISNFEIPNMDVAAGAAGGLT